MVNIGFQLQQQEQPQPQQRQCAEPAVSGRSIMKRKKLSRCAELAEIDIAAICFLFGCVGSSNLSGIINSYQYLVVR